MRETAEFRIPEETAREWLPAGVGTILGGSVRKVVATTDDPIYAAIGTAARELAGRGSVFFTSWAIRRDYEDREAAAAELWQLIITAVFEPAGEECGTVYDSTDACALCGAGRRQLSELTLDLRKIPRGKDIARTIADEVIVSQRLAERMVEDKLSGFALRPVRHRARLEDDELELEELSAGRELLGKAAAAGVPTGSWEFMVWMNRPQQAADLERAVAEHVLKSRRDTHRAQTKLPVWYQLLSDGAAVNAVPPTQYGIHPFDLDEEGRYVCPIGHVSGLNAISELYVARHEMAGRDFAATQQLVGNVTGLLVPAPMLLVSPKFREILSEEGVKGYRTEIAYPR